MTHPHKCPDCRCLIPTSRALDFEPTIDTWLAHTLIPTTDGRRLWTGTIYTAYANWCHQVHGRNPNLTPSRLTRHLRFKGYPFNTTNTKTNSLIGYRLAS